MILRGSARVFLAVLLFSAALTVDSSGMQHEGAGTVGDGLSPQPDVPDVPPQPDVPAVSPQPDDTLSAGPSSDGADSSAGTGELIHSDAPLELPEAAASELMLEGTDTFLQFLLSSYGPTTSLVSEVFPPSSTSSSPSEFDGPQGTGFTTNQRNMITTAANEVSFFLEYSNSALANLGVARDMAALARFGSIAAPALGALGPLIAVMVVFVSGSDLMLQYLAYEFQKVNVKLDNIESEIKGLPDVVDSANALETYIRQRNELFQVNTAFQTWRKTPFKSKAVYDAFAKVCDLHNPRAFLDARLFDFTADGSCSTPTQCLLDPNAGIALNTEYSRSGVLDYLKVFSQDVFLAGDLTVNCLAAMGALPQTINQTLNEVQALSVQLIHNLAAYGSGTMATAFYTQRFGKDIQDSLDCCNGDHTKTAQNLQAKLTAKYGDIMDWGVTIWNAVLTSEKEGAFGTSCDRNMPVELWKRSGGSWFCFRVGTSSGRLSYMIQFSPVELEDRSEAAKAPGSSLDSAIDECKDDDANHDDLTKLLDCVNGIAQTRGLLAVAYGNALHATYGNSFLFRNVEIPGRWASPGYGLPGYRFTAKGVSIVALPGV